jgi:uncharacterized cupredoxin-like copper-binding protein
MKRTLYLLAAAAAVAATVFAVAPFAAAHPAAKQKTTTIKVIAKEYKFILSKKSAPAGVVIFKVTNKGKIAHDFKIAGKKTPNIKPGKTAKPLKVTLKKGKKYPFKCTIDSHALFGMKGTFKAT